MKLDVSVSFQMIMVCHARMLDIAKNGPRAIVDDPTAHYPMLLAARLIPSGTNFPLPEASTVSTQPISDHSLPGRTVCGSVISSLQRCAQTLG